MNGTATEPTCSRISKDGTVTIPEELLEQCNIEPPAQLLVHGEERLVLEPLPSVAELRGVHAGRYEDGEVLAHLETMKEDEKSHHRKDG